MKKWLLISGILFSFSLPTALADFVDVDSQHPNFLAISSLEAEGIVVGNGDGTFTPFDPINRAGFVKIVLEAIDVSVEGVTGADFPDVAIGEWYGPYVYRALEMGLVDGDEDGSFYPAREVNFAEAAKILANAFDLEIGEAGLPWYKVYVDALAVRGAIPETVRSFDQKITRGEMAEMVWRLEAVATEGSVVSYADIEEGLVNVDLVRALPGDSDFVLEFDYTSEMQKSGLKGYLETLLVDSGLGTFEDLEMGLKEEYESIVDGFVDSFSYDRMLKPILQGDWEVTLALDVPDSLDTLDEFYDLDPADGDFDVIIVGRFEEYRKVNDFLGATFSRGDYMNVTHQFAEGIDYWTNPIDAIYMAKMGDVFVLTNTGKARADTLWRLQHAAGFDFENTAYANFADDENLISTFVKKKFANFVYLDLRFLVGGVDDPFAYEHDLYVDLMFSNGVGYLSEYSFGEGEFENTAEVITEENGLVVRQRVAL